MALSASPIAVLETAYRVGGSDEDWLDGVADRVAAGFRHAGSLGAVAHLGTGAVREGRRVLGSFGPYRVRSKYATDEALTLESFTAGVPDEIQERFFFSDYFAATVSEVLGLTVPLDSAPFWRRFWKAGVAEGLGVVGHDGGLGVVTVTVPLARSFTPSRAERRLWRRVANHLGSALRLRRATVAPERATAVLSARGRVLHVVQEAEAELEKLTLGLERRSAAQRLAAEPARALEAWQGLVDGRWSLVDHLDTDGQTFVLAVENQPGHDARSTLSDRQRAAVALASLGYGNKQIAYALGLSSGSVSMLLSRARALTGARSRAELVRGFKAELAGG